MPQLTRIIRAPRIVGGKPCIRGMRMTVGTIVGLIAAGRSHDDAAWRAEEVEVSPG